MQDPENYEKNKLGPNQAISIHLPKMIGMMEWSSQENVLDYGCGAGSTGYNFILPWVEKTESTLYSVDISQKMLDFARNNYPHPRIVYKAGNILDEFPFPHNMFDKVFAIHVFNFIRNLREALLGFHNILKPNGLLCFTSLTTNCCIYRLFNFLRESDMWRELMEGCQTYMPEWSNFEQDQGDQIMRTLLKTSGFQVVHLEVIERECVFDDIEVFLDVCMALNPCIDRIPTKLHAILKQDVRKIITDLADIPEDSTSITVRYEYIVGLVQKY